MSAQSPKSLHPSESSRNLPTPIYWCLLFLASFLLSLLVYSKTLRDSLIYDDIGIILTFSPARHLTWLHCLGPMDNGFWRPLNILLLKITHTFAHLNPTPYHILSLLIHAAVAATAGITFLEIIPWGRTRPACPPREAAQPKPPPHCIPRAIGTIITLAVTVASAAFPTVYMLSNSCDSLMALGILLVVIQWQRWLDTSRTRHLVFSALALLFALAGKETALVAAGIVLIQSIATPHLSRRQWLGLIPISAICLAHGLIMIVLQHRVPASYTNLGLGSISLHQLLERATRFYPATLFPGTFIMDPLWDFHQAHQALRLLIRASSVLVVAASASALILRRIPPSLRTAAFCFLSAGMLIWPTFILDQRPYQFQQQPCGRFVYAAIPFMIMGVACVILSLPRKSLVRYAAITLAGVWIALQIIIIRQSPGPRILRRTTIQWRNLIREIDRISPSWPPMHYVTFYTGPEYGSILLPTNYGMALMRVYFPNLLANYESNRTTPETTAEYVFDGRHLISKSDW